MILLILCLLGLADSPPQVTQNEILSAFSHYFARTQKAATLNDEDRTEFDKLLKDFSNPKTTTDEKVSLLNLFQKNNTGKEVLYFSEKIKNQLETLSEQEIKSIALLLRMSAELYQESLEDMASLASNSLLNLHKTTKVDIQKQVDKLPKKLAIAPASNNSLDPRKALARLKEVIGRMDSTETSIESFNFILEFLKDRQPKSLFVAEPTTFTNTFDVLRTVLGKDKTLKELHFEYLRLNDGKRDLENAIKFKKYEKLSQIGREYFYSLNGLQAELLYSYWLITKNEPLLAAAHLAQSLQVVELLEAIITSQKNKDLLSKIKMRLEVLGGIAFKTIGDTDNYEKVIRSIKDKNTVEVEKISLSSREILKIYDSIQPVKKEELADNYIQKLAQPTSDINIISANVIYSEYIEKQIGKALEPKTADLIHKIAKSKNFPLKELFQKDFVFDDFYLNKKIINLMKISLELDKINPEVTEHNYSFDDLNLMLHFAPVNTQCKILRLLTKFGEKAVPDLVNGLKSPDYTVQRTAAVGLSSLKQKAHSAIPYLALILVDTSNPRSNASLYAAEVLASIGEKGLPELIKGLQHANQHVQTCCIHGITIMGEKAHEAIPDLMKILKNPNTHITNAAARALGWVGIKAIPPLTKALKDEDANVRMNAALAFCSMQAGYESAIPELIIALKDKNALVRQRSTMAIARLKTPEAIPHLITGLYDSDPQVSHQSSTALGRLGKAALPELIKTLKDKDFRIRELSASAINIMGKEGLPALPQLIEALKDSHISVKTLAVRSISSFQEEALSALPDLIVLLKEVSPPFCYYNAQALAGIGEKALPKIIIALKSSDNTIRANALLAISYMGKKAESVIPILIENLKENNDTIRANTILALGSIEEKAEPAIPEIIKCLKDKNERVRSQSAFALARINRQHQNVLKALKEAEKIETSKVPLAHIKSAINVFENWVKSQEKLRNIF